ncbi:MAG: ABC transporter permease [Lautropia sp.]
MSTEQASMNAAPAGLAVKRFPRIASSIRRHAGLLGLLGLLLAAWVFVLPLYVPEYIFPTVGTVLEKGYEILQMPTTYQHIGISLQRLAGGFVLSAVLGIVFGIVSAMWRSAASVTLPLLKFSMGIPAITWVLLSIIWFKSPEVRVWFLMVIVMIPIVAINTYDGVRAIPIELYQMVKSLRPNTFRLMRMVVLPAATPFIFSGLRVGVSFSGRIAVFAEALSANTGIGAEMYVTNQTFDTAALLVWTAVLLLVLAMFDRLLTVLEQRWFRWRKELTTA